MTEPYTVTVYCEKCEKHYWENIELEKELAEQARLKGIGSEREARLMAEVEELKKEKLLMNDLVKTIERDRDEDSTESDLAIQKALKAYQEVMK